MFNVVVLGFAMSCSISPPGDEKRSTYITDGAPPSAQANALPEIEAGDGSPSDKLGLELLIIDCLGQDTRTAQNAWQGEKHIQNHKLKHAAKETLLLQ